MAEVSVGKSRKVALVAIVLVAVTSVAAWCFIRYRDEERRRVRVDAAIAQIELKSRGIAFLENGDYEEADKSFAKLVKQFPHETLGRRNLAISRLLGIEKLAEAEQPPQQVQAAIGAARRVIDQLLSHRHNDAASYILAADLAEKAKDKSQQVQHLGAAVRMMANW